MTAFVYLFRNSFAGNSPAGMQQQMQKWVAWMQELGAKGHLKDPGQPLNRAGKVVRGSAKDVTDGPFAEAKDIVGGFMVIEARDIDHAAEIARGCPVFETGGSVEIRPVLQTA